MGEILGFVGLGLLVGFLSGLFGVGGGFILVPMLNVVFGIPYNIAVGSSLCQMVGTSAAGTLKHRSYGHIDYRLALFVLLGALGGAETGARILMWLKGQGTMIVHGNEVGVMFVALNVIYVALLLFVGTSMMRESCQARRRPPQGGVVNTKTGQAIRRIRILPLISLPVSKIESISVWMLVGLGFMVGVLSGLLGVGGGFVMSPCLIYLIGIPTSVAIGTDLFQIMFTSIYGTFTHFFKGNVDFLLVLWILLGSLGGSQLGAIVNKRVRGAHIRYYFSWIVLIAVGIIIIKFLMVTGYLPV